MKVVSIDFETANRYPASICAAGLCSLDDGVIEDAYYSLVKPIEGVDFFSSMNIKIHGIRKEDVENAPSFIEVYKDIEPLLLDSIVVAHNASFDISCLREACKLAQIDIPKIKYVDTVRIAKKVFPNLESHRLNIVSEYIGCELEHHNAFSDARACLMIVVQAMNLANVYDLETLCKVLNVKVHSTK